MPVKAPGILKGIRNYQNNALGKSQFTIKESQVKNRIFWLNTRNGVPLFVYTPLRVFEENYERTILDKEGIGRHLVMTDKNNWTYLPSPIPEKSWGDTYVNSRVRDYNARVRADFAKALASGVIIEKGVDENTSNRYSVVFTKPFDLDAILNGFDMQLQSTRPNLGEVKKAVDELKSLREKGLEREGLKDIFGSINKDMAQENLIRSPQLISRVRVELAKYAELTAKAAELEGVLHQYLDEDKWMDQFIEALYTDSIIKKGALYVYDRDEEEDAWEPFANLMKERSYVEYAVYRHFRELDEKSRSVLLRKAARRAGEMTAAEDVTPLLYKLEGLYVSFLEARDSLEYERVEYESGDEMYGFYKSMTSKLGSIRRKLK